MIRSPSGPVMCNFNPPSPCGEGRVLHGFGVPVNAISIHPPRAGRDEIAKYNLPSSLKISIHPPRAGRDETHRLLMMVNISFQSTLPVRGGTGCRSAELLKIQYFNPPSPCGEGLHVPTPFSGKAYFNPPSPCGEGHWRRSSRSCAEAHFNPPSPCGEGQQKYTK